MLHPHPHTLTSYSTAGKHWSVVDIFSLRGLNQGHNRKLVSSAANQLSYDISHRKWMSGSAHTGWTVSCKRPGDVSPQEAGEWMTNEDVSWSTRRRKESDIVSGKCCEATNHSTHDDSTHRKHISHAAFGLFWLLPRLLLTSDWWMMLWAGP